MFVPNQCISKYINIKVHKSKSFSIAEAWQYEIWTNMLQLRHSSDWMKRGILLYESSFFHHRRSSLPKCQGSNCLERRWVSRGGRAAGWLYHCPPGSPPSWLCCVCVMIIGGGWQLVGREPKCKLVQRLKWTILLHLGPTFTLLLVCLQSWPRLLQQGFQIYVLQGWLLLQPRICLPFLLHDVTW